MQIYDNDVRVYVWALPCMNVGICLLREKMWVLNQIISSEQVTKCSLVLLCYLLLCWTKCSPVCRLWTLPANVRLDKCHTGRRKVQMKNRYPLFTSTQPMDTFVQIICILSDVRINFYFLRTFCPHLGSFLCCFFFHYVSAKFHLWPSSGDLPRPRIGMMSLVTVSPVITAFHSCLSHHVFGRNVLKEETTQKTTKMRTKSPQ